MAWGGWPGDPSPTPMPLPPDLPNEPNARLYPDLQAIAPTSLYVERTYGNRVHLRFATSIGNAGPGHLQIRGKVVGDMTQGTQEIVDAAGQVIQTQDVGSFELHPMTVNALIAAGLIARQDEIRGKNGQRTASYAMSYTGQAALHAS